MWLCHKRLGGGSMMAVLGAIKEMLQVLRDGLNNFCGTVLVTDSMSWMLARIPDLFSTTWDS